jgi:hypothetical protein
MRRSLPFLITLFSLLAACGPTLVRTDVPRFNELPPSPTPRTFTILPEPGQAGSLEFQRNADLVAAALTAQGWRAIPPSSSEAETVVTLRWGIGQPNTIVTQEPPPTFGTSFGHGRRGHWAGAGIGIPLGPSAWETRVVNYYPKWLEVRIADAAARRRGEQRLLFEGRSVSEGSAREIAPVMPYLVQGLFTGFPGANGTTVRVDVPVPET